jgi:DNA invertase Pin-like site-specific DNA recombinase
MNALVIIKSGGNDDYTDQLKKCNAYAQSSGWNVMNIYSNEQESASVDIDQHLSDIDVILTTDLTRIATELEDANSFLLILKRNGIKLFTVKDGEIADFSQYKAE